MMTGGAAALKVRNLTVAFGEVVAVRADEVLNPEF